MSELIPKRDFTSEGLSPISASKSEKNDNVDTQHVKMQVTITTTTSGHTIPINLSFSAPIAGEEYSLVNTCNENILE